MPVDSAGNRTELIMDPHSTIKRMNVSRVIEQYINACSREVTSEVRQMVAKKVPKDKLSKYLLGYYNIVSPRMADMVIDDKGYVKQEHIDTIVNDRIGIKLWVPTDNEPETMDIIRELRKYYPPVFGPITYKGASGKHVETKHDILIASMYIMVLEKTGRNWAGTASSKLSPYGVPAKLTAMDRNAAPARVQPIRFGESEVRLFAAFVGGDATSELLDRTNNIVVRKVVQDNLLRADKPTALKEAVDREEYPSGQSRILSLVRHFGECAGWRLKKEVNKRD